MAHYLKRFRKFRLVFFCIMIRKFVCAFNGLKCPRAIRRDEMHYFCKQLFKLNVFVFTWPSKTVVYTLYTMHTYRSILDCIIYNLRYLRYFINWKSEKNSSREIFLDFNKENPSFDQNIYWFHLFNVVFLFVVQTI